MIIWFNVLVKWQIFLNNAPKSPASCLLSPTHIWKKQENTAAEKWYNNRAVSLMDNRCVQQRTSKGKCVCKKKKKSWITGKDEERRGRRQDGWKVMVEKRAKIQERWHEYVRRGMQMDNKPPSRPPSTDGISPATPVLLVYVACISGASHQERKRPWRFLFP